MAFFNAFERSIIDASDRVRELVRDIPGAETASMIVVGDQSTGKSSTLESLAGIKLPRGDNIVTRVPLELACRRTLATASKNRYAVIRCPESNSFKNDTEIDTEDVSDCIERITNEVAGESCDVKNTPIYLTVYSPDVLDVTIVDLPGLVRVAVGQQSKDIDVQIREMVLNYIKPETAIILCVVPANVDFPTMECIRLAQEVDPLGLRTVGVVTKIDKAEEDILNKLEGKRDSDVKIAHGFYAIRNRTQAELKENITNDEARRREREFFKSHSLLRHANPHQIGVPALAEKLAQIGIQRIRETLPGTLEKIRSLLKEKNVALEAMAHQIDDPFHAKAVFTERLFELVAILEKLLDADYSRLTDKEEAITKLDDNDPSKPPKHVMHVAARLFELFSDFCDSIAQDKTRFLSDEYEKKVESGIREARAHGLSNFLSFSLFARMFKEEVAATFKAPAGVLLEKVRSHMDMVLKQLINRCFFDFPRLQAHVESNLNDLMDMIFEEAGTRISERLAEESDPFTLNDYYMSIMHEVRVYYASNDAEADINIPRLDSDDNQAISDFLQTHVGVEAAENAEMQISLFAFFKVCCMRTMDGIPMLARRLLKQNLCGKIASHVAGKDQTSLEHLFALMKPDSITQRKKELLDREIKSLKEALSILRNVV